MVFYKWRFGLDDLTTLDAIAKKISKLLRDLFWFHDEELGIVDPVTRYSFLIRVDQISRKLTEFDTPVTYRSLFNQSGMGRVLAVVKRPTARISNNSIISVSTLKVYLDGLKERLSLRTKTQVQLVVTEDATQKSCRVVCSGAMPLKKVGQLVAFPARRTDGYEFHMNRGGLIKGSYLELSLTVDSKLHETHGGVPTRYNVLLGDSAIQKKAEVEGFGCLPDKPVTPVRVFQGSILTPESGMVHDAGWESVCAGAIRWCGVPVRETGSPWGSRGSRRTSPATAGSRRCPASCTTRTTGTPARKRDSDGPSSGPTERCGVTGRSPAARSSSSARPPGGGRTEADTIHRRDAGNTVVPTEPPRRTRTVSDSAGSSRRARSRGSITDRPIDHPCIVTLPPVEKDPPAPGAPAAVALRAEPNQFVLSEANLLVRA